jgi:lysozyme family protein
VHDIAFSPPGSEARWDACIAWILEREGRYSNDRADRGGPTNMGITQRTLANWRHKDVTPEDVQNLTIDEAKAIYRANYWNAARCGDMPAGVDLSVFDAGTMSGPAMGVEFAQFAAGLRDKSVDGVVGSQTLKALSNVDPQALIDGIASARLAFYQKTVDGDATQQANLPGWRNRAELTRVRAQELLRAWDRENGLVA